MEISMGEDNEQLGPPKTNWAFTDKAMRQERAGALEPKTTPHLTGSTELAPLKNPGIPSTPAVMPPASDQQLGILGQWRANKLGRKAAMESIQLHYTSQLDALAHQLAKAAQVRKAQADVMAEEFLKELDTQHLAVLTEFGLRNKETRERALIELTDATASKLREVQEKDWPEELIRDTIMQLFSLRKRVVSEMMKELGGEYGEP
jgi:hypothetical protein